MSATRTNVKEYMYKETLTSTLSSVRAMRGIYTLPTEEQPYAVLWRTRAHSAGIRDKIVVHGNRRPNFSIACFAMRKVIQCVVCEYFYCKNHANFRVKEKSRTKS